MNNEPKTDESEVEAAVEELRTLAKGLGFADELAPEAHRVEIETPEHLMNRLRRDGADG